MHTTLVRLLFCRMFLKCLHLLLFLFTIMHYFVKFVVSAWQELRMLKFILSRLK